MSKPNGRPTPDDAVKRYCSIATVFGGKAPSAKAIVPSKLENMAAAHAAVRIGRDAMGLPELSPETFGLVAERAFSTDNYDPFGDAPFRVGLSLRNLDPINLKILRAIEFGLAADMGDLFYQPVYAGRLRTAYLAVVLGSLFLPSIGKTAQALAQRSLLARIQIPTPLETDVFGMLQLQQTVGFLLGARAVDGMPSIERLRRQTPTKTLVENAHTYLRTHGEAHYSSLARHFDAFGRCAEKDNADKLFTPDRCIQFVRHHDVVNAFKDLLQPQDFQFAPWRKNRADSGPHLFDAPFDALDAMGAEQTGILLYATLAIAPNGHDNHLARAAGINPYHKALYKRASGTTTRHVWDRLQSEDKLRVAEKACAPEILYQRWLHQAVAVYSAMTDRAHQKRLPPPNGRTNLRP